MISPETLRELWSGLDSRIRLRAAWVLIVLLAASLAWSLLHDRVTGLERRRAMREQVLKELLPLKASYQTARLLSDRMNGRKASLRPDDSLARIIEETGIRGRGIRISPLKGDDRSSAQEETADVRIEGISANEAVNLLYRLEKGSRPLTLRKVLLKTRFDNPALLDLALTVTLLRPAAGQAR